MKERRALGKMVLAIAAMLTTVFAMATITMGATNITPTDYVLGNEKVPTTSITYTQNNPVIQLGSSEKGVIAPLVISKAGTLKITISAIKLQKDTSVEIYTDAACTNRVSGMFTYLELGEVSEVTYVSFSTPGTYYLAISSYSSDYSEEQFTNIIGITAGYYNYSTKPIANGQTITYYKASSAVNKFSYVANVTGTVNVMTSYDSGAYVQMQDSKGNAISDNEWICPYLNSSATGLTFAVQKGKTYYFVVDPTSLRDELTFSLKSSAVKEKSGATKKKAVLVKAKKKVKGVIASGTNDKDWYKFKLKKNKKLVINLDGNISGNLKITVYNSKGKKVTKGTGITFAGKTTLKPTFGKMKKGTYYIKIENTKSSGGTYSLNWK